MLSSLALTVGLLVVGADGAPTIQKAVPHAAAPAESAKSYASGNATESHSSAPAYSQGYEGDYGDSSGYGCANGGCGEGGCGGGCSHCGTHGRRTMLGGDCGIWVSCCNMPQHQAYYPQDFGYFYFRPYNYTSIRPQQELVANWGGDRRHPYDTRFIFDKVYADMEAENLIQPERHEKDADIGTLGPAKKSEDLIVPKKDAPKKIDAPKADAPKPDALKVEPKKPGKSDLDGNTSNELRQPHVVRVEYVEP